MTGIIIITYNNESIFSRQIECIRKFCKDDFEIVIIDNSTNPEAIAAIKYYCTQLGIEVIKTNSAHRNGSESHSFAANLSYTILKDRFDYLFYLDHDCFPVKDFSVKEILKDHVFAGIGQTKSKTYLWPGCLMFDNRVIDKSLLDFSPNNNLGLDTGGNLYILLDKHPNKTVFFNEMYEENPHFLRPPYNFYSMINDGMFMHFVNSSNWNATAGNTERVNSLLNILQEKIK